MTIEKLLYWAAYAIPFILIVIGASTQKLIDKRPWHLRHFYCGIDLVLAVLGIALGNVLDLARVQGADQRAIEIAWTAVFITGTVALLTTLSGLHQDWGAEDKFGKGQIIVLGVASNAIGIALALAFVKMKVGGLL
jgi:hypothetical protein